MDGATGALDILQRMTNVAEKEQSYCFWDRTLCKAGGFTVIPLNARSKFPAKRVIGRRKVVDGKVDPFWWEYNGTDPSHPGIRVIDGMVVAKSLGKEQKIGADSDGGWIAYIHDRLLFVKYYPYFPDGKYIDNGLSVAHYFNERIAELEPLSPEATLRPEAVILPRAVDAHAPRPRRDDHEEARAVAATIPLALRPLERNHHRDSEISVHGRIFLCANQKATPWSRWTLCLRVPSLKGFTAEHGGHRVHGAPHSFWCSLKGLRGLGVSVPVVQPPGMGPCSCALSK
jgi:hypothetical protein